MEELRQMVMDARRGDLTAYETIAKQFQDMAVGYGYAVLGDRQLAEDAAQEAFLNAFQDLSQLRDPSAFPGWFRRILVKHVDRVRRCRRDYVAYDEISEVVSHEPGPADIVEQREVQLQLTSALGRLPAHQRVALTLFYIDGYSQGEISSFLEVPVGTVKSRLHAGRNTLKERMIRTMQEHLPEQRPSRSDAFAQKVMETFGDLIGRFGEHAVAAGGETYTQPYVYLSLHLVQMRAAGWADADFDEIAAVSGASALFGYQPGEFDPKYAHLHLDLDQRIADATGFGYEWVPFKRMDEAWELLKASIDTERPVKGWYWEDILFTNYRDAEEPKERRVFAMADGPDTFAKWWVWDEFVEWVELVEGRSLARFGRHTRRVQPRSAGEIAHRVMRELVEWSVMPPLTIRDSFPNAILGLAGIEAYATDCENSDLSEDWLACHDINPQWTARNSTAVYLGRIAKACLFEQEVNTHLLKASMQYHAAYECWQAFYKLLGHHTEEDVRKMQARRLAGAAVARSWLAHERAALHEVEQVLQILVEAP